MRNLGINAESARFLYLYNMRRVVALASICFLIAALLSSCGGGTSQHNQSSATSQAPATSIPATSKSTVTLPPSSVTTVATEPQLASLSPVSGPVGTRVTLSGSNFGSSPGRVTFMAVSGTPVFNAQIVSWSENSIVAVVPTGLPTGLAIPDVWNSAGVEAGPAGIGSWPEFTVTAQGTPTISGLSPQSAPVGARFTITGTNLGSASNGAVTFCEFCGTGSAIYAVAPVISWSTTLIVGTVPALQCGTAEVWVRVGTWNGEVGTMNIASCGS